MPDLASTIQSGSGNPWLFAATAVLLGALHGLEPGHSKTMMAGFIVAVRGTLAQAVLLAAAATLSHTFVVWVIALAGLSFGSAWTTAASEPYLQLASAAVIIALAAWMIVTTYRGSSGHAHHHHDHGHGHSHDGAGACSHHGDAHARMHEEEIRRRFAGGTATTGQIVMFGLTGGLIPCPASITVLLVCLQIKQLALGAFLVLCFSIGLGLTLVGVGAAAALGVQHVGARWSGLDALARRAPYLAGAVVALIGLYSGYLGWKELLQAA